MPDNSLAILSWLNRLCFTSANTKATSLQILTRVIGETHGDHLNCDRNNRNYADYCQKCVDLPTQWLGKYAHNQPKGTASDRFELLILNASFRQKHQNAAEDDDNAWINSGDTQHLCLRSNCLILILNSLIGRFWTTHTTDSHRPYDPEKTTFKQDNTKDCWSNGNQTKDCSGRLRKVANTTNPSSCVFSQKRNPHPGEGFHQETIATAISRLTSDTPESIERQAQSRRSPKWSSLDRYVKQPVGHYCAAFVICGIQRSKKLLSKCSHNKSTSKHSFRPHRFPDTSKIVQSSPDR